MRDVAANLEEIKTISPLKWAWSLSLTGCQKMVLVALAKHANRAGMGSPSHAELASDIGRSVDTVQRALKQLKQAGLVEWRISYGTHGRRIASSYTLKVGAKPQNAAKTKPQNAACPERAKPQIAVGAKPQNAVTLIPKNHTQIRKEAAASSEKVPASNPEESETAASPGLSTFVLGLVAKRLGHQPTAGYLKLLTEYPRWCVWDALEQLEEEQDSGRRITSPDSLLLAICKRLLAEGDRKVGWGFRCRHGSVVSRWA